MTLTKNDGYERKVVFLFLHLQQNLSHERYSVFYFALQINAQSTLVFSKQYNFGNSYNQLSFSVFNYGNDYLLTGLTSSTSSNFGGIGIIRSDSAGNQKWQKQSFGHTGYRYANNTGGQMFIKLKNGNLLFTGEYVIATNYHRAVLARINQNNGDTLWVKEYIQAGDTCNLQCCSEQSDSSIIVLGYKYYASLTASIVATPFIMKIDKNGNYKWHKYLMSPVNYEPFYQKIFRINDNDFIAIGINFYDANNYQSSIIKLDTSANISYNVGTAGVNYSFLYDLIKLQDGNFLAAGVYWSYHNSSTGATKYRKLFYKFDGLTGAKLNERRYNWEANVNGVLSIQQQFDGSIIAMGGTGYITPINTYNAEADIFKLSSNLDSVRTTYIGDGILQNQKACSSFILTPDGGFALAMQLYPSPGQQKFWLIKTDSLGCDSANCAATTGVSDTNFKNELIKSYPNPTSRILYISSIDIELSDSQIEIRNTLGETVFKTPFKKEIDVSQFVNGCYFITITNKEKQRFHSKFIKE